MMDRRKFLKLPLLSIPALLFRSVSSQAKPGTAGHLKVSGPVVVSTWDSGLMANKAAWPILQKGGRALDAVEAAGRASEAEPSCCVGLAAYPDRDGRVTLDSCIMNGNGDCGAVSFLERIKHPVSVARMVMEKTPHTMLVGMGARAFAVDQGFPTQNLLTPRAEAAWRDWLKTADYAPRINSENTDWRSLPGGPGNHDTIGLLAIDAAGRMAGACTTSGMAFKMRGRVGDSPLIGAGLYVDDEIGGATATGVGEDVIRVAGSHAVVEAMRAGLDPTAACRRVIERLARLRGSKIANSQVALVALDKGGRTGAFALQPGFTFAVTDANGQTRIEPAGALFESS